MEAVVTTLPVISSTQNGNDTSAQTVDFYDANGNLAWSKDARGFLTENVYDPTTGLLTKSIQDADTSLVSSAELPTDPTTYETLATPLGGGQNLVTDYSYDAQDRLVQTLGPVHMAVVGATGSASAVRTASWTSYDDADHATLWAQGYQTVASGLSTLVNPLFVTITNPDGQGDQPNRGHGQRRGRPSSLGITHHRRHGGFPGVAFAGGVAGRPRAGQPIRLRRLDNRSVFAQATRLDPRLLRYPRRGQLQPDGLRL